MNNGACGHTVIYVAPFYINVSRTLNFVWLNLYIYFFKFIIQFCKINSLYYFDNIFLIYIIYHLAQEFISSKVIEKLSLNSDRMLQINTNLKAKHVY